MNGNMGFFPVAAQPLSFCFPGFLTSQSAVAATTPVCGAFSHSISSLVLLRDAPVLSPSLGQHNSLLPSL